MARSIGYAVRITTNPASGSPVVYRWARVHKGAYDAEEEAWYEARIARSGPITKALRSFEQPVSDYEPWWIDVEHRAGEWWATVAQDREDLHEALAEMWWTESPSGDPHTFAFDTSDPPHWVGLIDVDSIDLDDTTLRIAFRDPRERHYERSCPAETIDADETEDADESVTGQVVPWLFGTIAGRRDLWVPALCIDVGDAATSAPTVWKLTTGRDADDDDTTGPSSLGVAAYVYAQQASPVVPAVSSVDGPFRVIASADFDSENPLANWSSESARTIPLDAITNVDAAAGTFELDLPIRADDADPGDGPVDSYGRVTAIDIRSDDVVMCQGDGQRTKNPAGTVTPSQPFAFPPARVLAHHVMRTLAGLSADRIEAATFFSSAEWASGTATAGERYCAGYYTQPAPVRDILGALAFEASSCIVFRNGKEHLEAFDVAAPPTLDVVLGRRNIARPRIAPARWAPRANRVTVRRLNTDTEYFDRPKSVRADDVDSQGRIGIVEYKVETRFVWLGIDDHADPDGMRDLADDKLTYTVGQELVVECDVNPLIENGDALAVAQLAPNDWLAFWWDAPDPHLVAGGVVTAWILEENAEPYKVLAITVEPDTVTARARLLKVNGRWARYREAGVYDFTFPTSLSGETGYGSGSATTWNAAWSDALKAYAMTHFGYYAPSGQTRIDPSDASTELGSIYSP